MSEDKGEQLLKEYYQEVSKLYWGMIEKNELIPAWLHKAYMNISFIIINMGSAGLQYGV